MSQLIQLRQRIRAIQTTQKITHAMRLIAMSTHSSMRAQQPSISFYHQQYAELFSQVYSSQSATQAILAPAPTATKPLYILVGSQKGLCGAFNTHLFSYIRKNIAPFDTAKNDYIAIGKKAIDFCATNNVTPLATYNDFMPRTLTSITEQLTSFVLTHATEYQEISMISNLSISFFTNEPATTQLLPLAAEAENTEKPPIENYIWDEPKEIILKTLGENYIRASIESVLFQSLFAEQAARFQSMDSATRNAKELLELAERQYNKLRQAKITKELTELTSSFLS